MKSNNLKILSGLLSLILLLNLCACGRQKTPEIRETVPGVDPQTGEWIGEGECYTVAKAELPDYCQQTFWLAGEQYFLLSNLNTFQSDLCRGERVIYHEDDFIDTVFPTSDSIWRLNDIRQEDGRYAELKQLSPEGTEKSSFSFKYAEDDVGRQFAVDTGLLYLNTMTRIHVFTLNGEKLAEIPHSDWAGRLVKDASGASGSPMKGNSVADVCSVWFRKKERWNFSLLMTPGRSAPGTAKRRSSSFREIGSADFRWMEPSIR